VTRKVGGAACRNRVKRRLREVFRIHRVEMGASLDLVVNAHPSIRDRAMCEIEREFLASFRRVVRALDAAPPRETGG
jgi:ribonuclease P protein component